MPSTKKPASSKRASLPREASCEKRFAKDWERLSRSGRYKMKQLKEAMMLLIANDAPLGSEWLDKALKGDWSDHRECHLGGDFLLISSDAGSAGEDGGSTGESRGATQSQKANKRRYNT